MEHRKRTFEHHELTPEELRAAIRRAQVLRAGAVAGAFSRAVALVGRLLRVTLGRITHALRARHGIPGDAGPRARTSA